MISDKLKIAGRKTQSHDHWIIKLIFRKNQEAGLLFRKSIPRLQLQEIEGHLVKIICILVNATENYGIISSALKPPIIEPPSSKSLIETTSESVP